MEEGRGGAPESLNVGKGYQVYGVVLMGSWGTTDVAWACGLTTVVFFSAVCEVRGCEGNGTAG